MTISPSADAGVVLDCQNVNNNNDDDDDDDDDDGDGDGDGDDDDDDVVDDCAGTLALSVGLFLSGFSPGDGVEGAGVVELSGVVAEFGIRGPG